MKLINVLALAVLASGFFTVSTAGAAEGKQQPSFSELVAQYMHFNVQRLSNKVQVPAQTANDVPPQVICPGPGTGMPNPGTGTCDSQQK